MHRRWFPCVALVGALLLPAGAAHAASCPGADTPVSATTLASAKAAVFCIVNAERDARGLPALERNDKLALAAQRHTDDMVARNYFDHFAPLPSPFGVDPGARLTAAGYDWQAYGENIATGQTTPREVMTAWIRSHGHCRNILSPDVTQLGIGIAAVPATLLRQSGGTWTQDFGNPRGTVAPDASSAPQSGCDPNGYPSLTGLDAAPQPAAGDESSSSNGSAPSPVAGTTPAPQQEQQDSGSADSPSDRATTSALSRTLTISLRHVAGRLAVSGAIRPWDGRRHRVNVVVRRSGHTLRRTRARLDKHGRFRVRVPSIPGAGPLAVTVSVGALRVTRTVGR